MRVLTTTMCYPTPADPDRGIFVQRRALALARLGHDIHVISPQPWCPILRGDAIPNDQHQPLPTSYPRMFSIPVVGWATDGLAYARALRRTIRNIHNTTGFDLIDAHFEYPDGVGATLAAKRVGLPVVVTVRGKIVSLSKRAARRAQIRTMLRRADAIIVVSKSLARCARDLAGENLHVDVIPNGIDASTFHPLDRAACKRSLEWSSRARYVLSVGHLQRLKGFDRLVSAWPKVRATCGDVRLILAGSRRGESAFAAQLLADIDRINREHASQFGEPCIEFVGPQSPEQLNRMYNAADLVASTSRSEGWCNAIAESLAVGTPVVATDVGGNREQIHSPALGIIVPDGDNQALAEAIAHALANSWDRARIAEASSRRTWEHAARQVEAVFTRVLAARRTAVNHSASDERTHKSAPLLEVPG